jgi:hypothetical protein
MIDEFTVAMSMPSVVLDRAIHLYRDPPAFSPLRISAGSVACAAGTRSSFERVWPCGCVAGAGELRYLLYAN